MRCLPVEVYKCNLGDCSNGGLSSKVNEVYIPCASGFLNVEEDDPKLVRIVTKDLGFSKHTHAEPVAEKPKGTVGYMFGGTFIYSSDSRFRDIAQYPIPLHDRVEAQAVYNDMFNS